MAMDGTSHFFSDLAGIGQGFRYGNLWLAAHFPHTFPASFYSAGKLSVRLIPNAFIIWRAVWNWSRLVHLSIFG